MEDRRLKAYRSENYPTLSEDPLDYVTFAPGCWLWKNGQCHERPAYHAKPAHRVVYERLVGPIPRGKILHHECENLRCVNPMHMIPMTHSEHRFRHPATSHTKEKT